MRGKMENAAVILGSGHSGGGELLHRRSGKYLLAEMAHQVEGQTAAGHCAD